MIELFHHRVQKCTFIKEANHNHMTANAGFSPWMIDVWVQCTGGRVVNVQLKKRVTGDLWWVETKKKEQKKQKTWKD